VSRQLDDCAAVDELGVRLPAYAGVRVPTVLLGGSRSPDHFGERMAALAAVMPRAETTILRRQGHHANVFAPGRVARLISAHAVRVFG
jgi:pimeloyl-ACP methyl ester carboxylesterase